MGRLLMSALGHKRTFRSTIATYTGRILKDEKTGRLASHAVHQPLGVNPHPSATVAVDDSRAGSVGCRGS
jgi:hypothetical protein